MSSTVNVKIVESLSEQQTMVQQRIRERAYERYLNRVDGSDQHLDDWLAAEGELTLPFTIESGKTSDGLVASVQLPDGDQDVLVEATSEEVAVSITGSHPGFAIAQLPFSINPNTLQAKIKQGAVELTMRALVRAAAFKESA